MRALLDLYSCPQKQVIQTWICSHVCATQALARAFVCSVRPLEFVWNATTDPNRPSIAAEILNICAKLQFCRMRLDFYTDLLKDVFAHAADHPMVQLHNMFTSLLSMRMDCK